jgi:hypothetical protein
VILSREYNFLFIKTAKTAGTSIEVELARIVEPQAVVTPVYPREEGHFPRNYSVCEYGCCGENFTPHISAAKVKGIVGRRAFRSMFKFCVEREPVDKCVSAWSMWRNSPNHVSGLGKLSWPEYVETGKFPMCAGRWRTPSQGVIVDKILRFENLETELKTVAGHIGLDNWCGLKARAKAGFREVPAISAQQREKIYNSFALSNQHTGYKIEDSYALFPE